MQGVPDSEGLYNALEALAAEDIEDVRRIGQQVREQLGAVAIPPEVAASRYCRAGGRGC